MEKQKQKAAKRAEQKEAKLARREAKKAEKEVKEQQREKEDAKQQLKAEAQAAEERKAQPSPAVVAAAAERVHDVSPDTAPVVDEITAYLSFTAAQLDDEFERLLRTTAKTSAAASAPPLDDVDSSLAGLSLTSADVGQSQGVDYGKLDAAVLPSPAFATPEEEAALVTERLRKEEEDADFLAYELQQRGDRRVDEEAEDEYQTIPGDDDASPALRPVQPSGDVPEHWEDEAAVVVEEEDEKATLPPAGDVDIDALDLQDLTEEEIIAAYIEQIQEMEDEERVRGEAEEGGEENDDGVERDVSAAEMSSALQPRLLSDDTDDEEKQARRKELAAKRARDAAEGILDWENWSSDDGSDDEVEEEEEGVDVEEEKDLSASEESKGQWEYDSDDSGIQQRSTKRSPLSLSSSSLCRCFVPGSAEDSAHVAKQMEGFFLSPVRALTPPHTALRCRPSSPHPTLPCPSVCQLQHSGWRRGVRDYSCALVVRVLELSCQRGNLQLLAVIGNIVAVIVVGVVALHPSDLLRRRRRCCGHLRSRSAPPLRA